MPRSSNSVGVDLGDGLPKPCRAGPHGDAVGEGATRGIFLGGHMTVPNAGRVFIAAPQPTREQQMWRLKIRLLLDRSCVSGSQQGRQGKAFNSRLRETLECLVDAGLR
jgi:hypothetical protein